MSVFSKRSHEGYLVIDHRASPGLPTDLAIRLGYKPEGVKEGSLYETATLGCLHCGNCYVKNPWRVREREHCYECNRYMCDACYAESKLPGYVHRTIYDKIEEQQKAEQLADLLRGGRQMVDLPHSTGE